MTRILLNRPISALMLFSGIVLLGGISLFNIPRQLFPDIEKPSFVVITPYTFSSAGEIENLISRPLEEALSSVPGVSEIVTESHQNASIIRIKLRWGTNLSQAVIDARQKIDMNINRLPEDSGNPIILKLDPSQLPVITLVVKSSMHKLYFRDTFEKEIRPLLERIPGIAAITVAGGIKREIHVNTDPRKMIGYGIGISELAQAISRFNFEFPVGYAKEGDREFYIKYSGRLQNLEEIKELPVKVGENGSLVKLKDIGSVKFTNQRRTGYSLYNGEDAILLNLYKEPGANDIDVAAISRSKLKDLEERFGGRYAFEIIQDNTVYIEESILSVVSAAILGSVIAFLVMVLIMGEILPAIYVIITIPVSILLTFVLMNFSGISLNMMSLGGLALGVGMMVDSSIVVVESIENEIKNGKRFDQNSIINGVNNVRSSIIASTLTSVVVFLPVVFMEGLSAAIFSDLALTISYSLVSSLFCAFTLTPLLYSLDIQNIRYIEFVLVRIEKFFAVPIVWTGNILVKIEDLYERTFRFVYHRKKEALGVSALLILIGILGFLPLEKEIFPAVSNNSVSARVMLIPGMTYERSVRVMKNLHEKFKKVVGVKGIVTRAGYEPEDPRDLIEGTRGFEDTNTIVYFHEKVDFDSDTVDEIKNIVEGYISKESEARLASGILESLIGIDSRAVFVNIKGDDRNKIRDVSLKLLKILEKKGEENHFKVVDSTLSDARSVWDVKLNRAKTSLHGLSPENILESISSVSLGKSATKFYEDDQRFEVRVFQSDGKIQNTDQLQNIPIPVKDGSINLAELISLSKQSEYTRLLRVNQEKMERITILPGSGIGISGLVSILEEVIDQNKAGSGVHVEVVRSDSELLKSLNQVFFSFILSFILIYQILASQFESLLEPVLLIISVPVMLFGVVIALFATGYTLNINSGIGMIMLIGIVVNNSILIYENIELQKNKTNTKKSKKHTITDMTDLVMMAAKARLRPILIATITTIMGMLPLALEGSDGYQSSLAITVMGGLAASTLVTMVIYPLLYLIRNRK